MRRGCLGSEKTGRLLPGFLPIIVIIRTVSRARQIGPGPQLKAAAQKLEPLGANVSLFIAVREPLAVESVSLTNQCTEKMLAR